METVTDFVGRTGRPLLPYLEGCYPWAYAHHYLRLERESLPSPLQAPDECFLMEDTVHLVRLWCGMTGESIDDAVRTLADAYLRRWGIAQPAAVPHVDVEPTPARMSVRRVRRSARRAPVRRTRTDDGRSADSDRADLAGPDMANDPELVAPAVGRASVALVDVAQPGPATAIGRAEQASRARTEDRQRPTVTRADLLDEARQLGIAGRWSMSKTQLLETIAARKEHANAAI
jgi:hypothetical protein